MPAKQAKVTIHLTQEDADWLVEHLKKRVGWDNDPTWVETQSVRRDRSGIKTLSIRFPSSS